MLCIDWSLINSRVTTVMDCGISRNRVFVLVAVVLYAVAYPPMALDITLTTGSTVKGTTESSPGVGVDVRFTVKPSACRIISRLLPANKCFNPS